MSLNINLRVNISFLKVIYNKPTKSELSTQLHLTLREKAGTTGQSKKLVLHKIPATDVYTASHVSKANTVMGSTLNINAYSCKSR